MSQGHSVLGVANEFLSRADDADRQLTPMHLQKLCYMAHGFTLALLDRPLTKETVEAWDFGPVYPELYDALKAFGGGSVSEPIRENNWASAANIRGSIVNADLNGREIRILDKVWADYGRFDAWQLSALTHEDDSPWAEVYKRGKKNVPIPNRLIKRYFVDLTHSKV